MHLKIAHSKEHQLQRPLPQLYRQQPGKIALNLSLRNLRPLRSKVSELSQCRLPTATTTPLRRQFLRCLIGFLRDCQSLVAGDSSIEFRAKRAWEAGFWAGLTLQGRVRTPRASPSFPLRPKVYVILRTWIGSTNKSVKRFGISTGSQDAWKEATWCATLSHHCLKPTSIVKEPDPASLHNINGADPKKVPGRWPSNHEDFGVASCRRSGLLYLHAGGYSVVQRGGELFLHSRAWLSPTRSWTPMQL